MEVRRTIADAHEGAILCVAYNAQRREIFTGSQDTLIKVWLAESGELLRTLQEHAGWVTGLAFAPELRVLFSCSIDGRILVWSKNELLQKEKVGSGKGESADSAGPLQKGGPLYCLAWDARRHNLVAGANGHIWVYTAVAENVDLTSRDRPLIKYHSVLRDAHSSRGMEEPVRAIISTEGGKLFSVGYDRSLCIWDTDHLAQTGLRGDGKAAKKKKGGDGGVGYGDALLKKTGGKDNCHDGAISAVTFDPDNNWIITGSFDRCVKIWAGDGKKVADIDGFPDTLTGLAYCPATKTLWMSSNSASPLVYDPRSATDITPFLQQTDTSTLQQREAKERIQRLFRINETGELLASTSTRNLVMWRFNPYGACSILRCHTDWVEVLSHCYKEKAPTHEGTADGEEVSMVLFSGGADSVVRRWEPSSRMNPYLYSNSESLPGHQGAVLCALYCDALDAFITGGDDHSIRIWPVAADEPGAERADKPADKPAAENPQTRVLWEHTDRVTGLVCMGHTLASASWDLTLRLWDLSEALLPDQGASSHWIENAHDDYILSLAHSPELDQIATASADQGAKLWDLAVDTEPCESVNGSASVPEGRKGKRFCGVLKGHGADVSHIKWNAPHGLWVTGSEDASVRFWTPEGVEHSKWLPGDAVTALAIDQKGGFVIAASMDRAVRVYDPVSQEVVQQHVGHSDAVRCIIHVPEKQQYLTASWDRTIRVWRAYMADGRNLQSKEDAPAGGTIAEEGKPEADDGALVEERQPTYAELHPLIEPKCLEKHAGRGHDYFSKKVAAEDPKEKRKKKQSDDEVAAKAATGLSLKLNDLESELRSSIQRTQDKPLSKEEKVRGRPTIRSNRGPAKGKVPDAPKR